MPGLCLVGFFRGEVEGNGVKLSQTAKCFLQLTNGGNFGRFSMGHIFADGSGRGEDTCEQKGGWSDDTTGQYQLGIEFKLSGNRR